MQKLLFTCLLLLCGGLAEAQIEKGKYMLGGQLDIIDIGSSVVRLDLDAAYFFNDRLAFGVATFGFLNGPYFVGVQSRYVWPLLEKTYVYGQAGFYASGGIARFSAFPGVMYFLNERVALEGRLGGIGGGGIGLSLLF
jgi:hypothetical protein